MPPENANLEKFFEDLFADGAPPMTGEAQEAASDWNTSIADYVWLPIRFDGATAYIDWRDEWRLEDFD